jgi:hypothetical protein
MGSVDSEEVEDSEEAPAVALAGVEVSEGGHFPLHGEPGVDPRMILTRPVRMP